MPLEVAAHAGFCMGVRRAVEMAEKAAGGMWILMGKVILHMAKHRTGRCIVRLIR